MTGLGSPVEVPWRENGRMLADGQGEEAVNPVAEDGKKRQ